MKSRDKRLRRQARLARNKVLDEHRDRINALFFREEAGEDIYDLRNNGCNLEAPTCLVCLEDRRFEREYKSVTRAVNHYWYVDGPHRKSFGV